MKALKLCLFLFLTTAFSACNLLDETSPNDLSASDAIKDGASAEAALLGVYSSMQQKGYYGDVSSRRLHAEKAAVKKRNKHSFKAFIFLYFIVLIDD